MAWVPPGGTDRLFASEDAWRLSSAYHKLAQFGADGRLNLTFTAPDAGQRSLLTGAFSGTPDQLIDDLVATIKGPTHFDVKELFDVIRSKGRSLELTEDRFWQMGYGSDTVHLLFNLWYPRFNYNPAYENHKPQVDTFFHKVLCES